MIMQDRKIQKDCEARHLLKVTSTDSPKDSDHLKVDRLTTVSFVSILDFG